MSTEIAKNSTDKIKSNEDKLKELEEIKDKNERSYENFIKYLTLHKELKLNNYLNSKIAIIICDDYNSKYYNKKYLLNIKSDEELIFKYLTKYLPIVQKQPDEFYYSVNTFDDDYDIGFDYHDVLAAIKETITIIEKDDIM